jgi:sRNA-binding carbon storage regulator CsrA
MFIVLQRLGESIRIGESIEVRIVRCSRLPVQLTIKAPTTLTI